MFCGGWVLQKRHRVRRYGQREWQAIWGASHYSFLCSFQKYVGNQFRSTMEFPWIDIVFYSFDVVSIALIALRTKAADNAGNPAVVKIHVQRACVPHRFCTATDKNIGSVFRRKHPSAHKCDWPTHVLCSCNRFATAFARWHLTWNTSVLYHVQVHPSLMWNKEITRLMCVSLLCYVCFLSNIGWWAWLIVSCGLLLVLIEGKGSLQKFRLFTSIPGAE